MDLIGTKLDPSEGDVYKRQGIDCRTPANYNNNLFFNVASLGYPEIRTPFFVRLLASSYVYCPVIVTNFLLVIFQPFYTILRKPVELN